MVERGLGDPVYVVLSDFPSSSNFYILFLFLLLFFIHNSLFLV